MPSVAAESGCDKRGGRGRPLSASSRASPSRKTAFSVRRWEAAYSRAEAITDAGIRTITEAVGSSERGGRPGPRWTDAGAAERGAGAFRVRDPGGFV